MPLMIILIAVQAFIEERYIIEPLLGETYRTYRRRVGMLLPRCRS